MYKLKYALPAVAALALGVAATSANAAAAKTNAPMGVGSAALGGATCGDARICAYVGQNALGTPVLRSKNVASVFSPVDGVTCIKPKAGVISIGKVVPLVTVEWGQSFLNDLLAFYEDIKVDCPSGYLEVRMYDLNGNLNPRVAFNLVVD
mgnify:CR=1 FL=1